MAYQPDYKRLGEAVRQARVDLMWSKERAAREAGISSITWKRVEDGHGGRDVSINAIEKALGWAAGHWRVVAAAENETATLDEATALVDGDRGIDHLKRVIALATDEVLLSWRDDVAERYGEEEADKWLTDAFRLRLEVQRQTGETPPGARRDAV